MHKKILAFILALFIITVFSGFSITWDEGGILQSKTQLGENDPASLVYRIINYALLFLGIITLIMIIVGGFMWMFAFGDEEKIKKAQGLLKGALMGLIIVMASYGLAQYVFNQLIEITAQI